MKFLRYSGAFLSQVGEAWRVEIWQEAESAWPESPELSFPAESPLKIEWFETALHEPICGASATLRIISPGDRTFTDLYTVDPKGVRLDVYRGGELFWRGLLDPEFYEEPYEMADNYDVELTFSDFGPLQRDKWAESGFRSINSVIHICLAAVELEGMQVRTSRTSTETADVEVGRHDIVVTSGLSIRSDNFYDEDGEPSTLWDVLRSVLQPLGLKIIQRNGIINVFDLNGIYKSTASGPVQWDGDRQTLSAGPVYNNVELTFSQYVESEDLCGGDMWPGNGPGEFGDGDVSGLPQTISPPDGTYTRINFKDITRPTPNTGDPDNLGFALYLSPNAENVTSKASGVPVYKIVPKYCGQQSQGLAVVYPLRYHIYSDYIWQELGTPPGGFNFSDDIDANSYVMLASKGVWLPQGLTGVQLRISIPMFIDCRLNPFADPHKTEKGFLKKSQEQGGIIYAPMLVRFHSDAGGWWHWTNQDMLTPNAGNKYQATLGRWVQDKQVAFAAWYDTDNRKKKSPGYCGSFVENHQTVPAQDFELPNIITKGDSGQYLPPPPPEAGAGTLYVCILHSGWRWALYGYAPLFEGEADRDDFGDKPYSVKWLLLKNPEVSIVNVDVHNREIDGDDVVYSAELDERAKDPLELELRCGSRHSFAMNARGLYYTYAGGSGYKPMTQVKRTQIAKAEELLLNTIYSQYATRSTVISGEARALSSGFLVAERNQDDRKFLVTADVLDCIAGTSELTLTELKPEEYAKR